METLEFLGGKYRKTEQIVPGPVQTFRARESSTGRDVFVHRVSTSEEPAEQVALLRMLTTVLLRSPEARRLVLDFGDEQGFWYVVTASEPRCLVLREWLQFELNRADDSGPVAENPPPSPPSIDPVPSSKPEALKRDETPPGDFTKLFQTSRPTNPVPPLAPSPSTTLSPPEKAAEKPAPPIQSEPGEFTRVFQSFKPQLVQPSSPSAPAAPASRNEEQGEFTKFFQSGLSSGGNKPSNPEVKRSQDRPSRPGFVQRPNTPMPPLPQKLAEPGEFTRIFSHPGPEVRKQNDIFADPPVSSAARHDALTNGGDFAPTKPPQARELGEYTRIFGGGTVPSPAEQSPITPKPPVPAALDDPLQDTRHFASAPPAPPPVRKGPSEYTMVIQGNRPLQEVGAGNASPAAEPLPAAGLPSAAIAPPLPKAPPAPQVPQVKTPLVPKPPALAPAQVKIPAPGNKKLVVFFAILAVLSVILILLVVLITVKK